jgi:hypothetical protein
MLTILSAVEKELPVLLKDESAWRSVYVDYHPPTVERLWLNWREFRVYLHRIHACPPREALFHPHPWPSAMRILSGAYEMAVGYGKGEAPPPIAALVLAEGNFRYEMTDPDAWHYVRPIGGPTVSLMVSGKPWERWAPKSEKAFHPLNAEQCKEIFQFFRQHYKKYRLLSPNGSIYESEQKGNWEATAAVFAASTDNSTVTPQRLRWQRAATPAIASFSPTRRRPSPRATGRVANACVIATSSGTREASPGRPSIPGWFCPNKKKVSGTFSGEET